jgi:hypothetical protein
MCGPLGRFVCAALLVSAPFVRVSAQEACGYDRCALSISPRLTALDVVRGANEERVASLAFLWPRDVSAPFRGDEGALRFAARASRHRRLAAVFTDVGLVAVVTGLSRSARGGHGDGRAIAGAVLAFVASSVSIHFSADADLARAVWTYNRRFAGGAPPVAGEK